MVRAVEWTLAFWLVCIALMQISSRRGRIATRLGRLVLILPDWRFFGPVPTTCDYVLYRRVRPYAGYPAETADRAFAAYERVTCIGYRRSAVRSLWHPEGRRLKIYRDAIDELLAVSRERDAGVTACKDSSAAVSLPDSTVLSDAYLVLLASAMSHVEPQCLIQFSIFADWPGRHKELLLQSRWHTVTGSASE